MKEKQQALKRLDEAIDRADVQEIDKELQALCAMETQQIQAEDPYLFSARVQKLHNEKEKSNMKAFRKPWKIAIVAAVAAALGVTAYAASALNWFSFVSNGKYVTLSTTESMTQGEAKAFLEQDQATEPPEGVAPAQAHTQDFTFDSVSQAQQELDMPLVLPALMPEMDFDSATGQVSDYNGSLETRLCWLNFADEQGRLLGVTVYREIVTGETSVTGYTTHDYDPDSYGSYKRPDGTVFATMTDTNNAGDKTAHIATTLIGEYEYTLAFYGFDEAQRQQMLDSVDLTAYQ